MPVHAAAEEFAKPVRIGVLTNAWGPPQGLEGIVEALVEMGHQENVDFVIGVRFTSGESAALNSAAEDIVAAGVDILVPVGSMAAEAARAATPAQPIVFMAVADPLERGFIDSFSRPGGNITGVTDFNIDLSGKRLQLLQALVPQIHRVLFAYSAHNPFNVQQAAEYRDAAAQLGLVLVERPLGSMEEARTLLHGLGWLGVDGILSPNDVDLNVPGFILEASARDNLPVMFDIAEFVEKGGFASYGVDYRAAGHQAARLIDQIIRGTDPAEIPVETAIQLEFVINAETAGKLGVAIPTDLLLQADRILE
jgi:putative ABC transport system substrate-binding protein